MDATKAGLRMAEIAPLWAWLPAFRAVAESEHLPSAARALGVTASTVSRAIAALEGAIGKQLFERTGRSLRLNPDGEHLLAAVRDAMRWIHDGVAAVAGGGFRGPFVVASGGAGTTALVAQRLAELRERHPELVPHIVSPRVGRTLHELLRGELDIAFQETEESHPGLVTRKVAEIERGVYCGREHPFYGREVVAPEELSAAEFVAAPGDETHASFDGWPPAMPRRIAMVVDQLRVGVDVCAAMPLLAVLPHALAAPRGDALWRLPVDFIESSSLHAIHRRPLGKAASLANELVELMRGA
ncbi:MAG: LysR family transcriptional regulator [Planctomycetes bacterium]|nr:LysR family transcriptional regulator [Planctomycetota bacterium]